MSDPDQVQPKSDDITDIPIEGTVKYLKALKTTNQKIIQKFTVANTEATYVYLMFILYHNKFSSQIVGARNYCRILVFSVS